MVQVYDTGFLGLSLGGFRAKSEGNGYAGPIPFSRPPEQPYSWMALNRC